MLSNVIYCHLPIVSPHGLHDPTLRRPWICALAIPCPTTLQPFTKHQPQQTNTCTITFATASSLMLKPQTSNPKPQALTSYPGKSASKLTTPGSPLLSRASPFHKNMISNSPLGGTAPTFPGSDQLYLGIHRSGVSRWWCAVGQIPKQGLVSCQTLRSVSGRDVRSGGGVRLQNRTDCRIPSGRACIRIPKTQVLP